MAVTEQRNLFNPQIEALAEQYTKSMGDLAKKPFTAADITGMAPQVAPQTGLQQQATTLTGAGIGSYSPYMAQAQQAGATAGTGLGLAQQGLGIATGELTGAGTALGTAGTTTAGVSPYISAAGTGLGTAAGLTGTGTGTGAGSIASYMSPYQSQVIDTTLAEFDKQAAMRQQGISDAAVALGGFGGGREGVMQSEYQSGSDAQRAALQAQMLQQGFGQAAGMRQQDYVNQMGLAQGQLGLGQAQLGLGSAQAGQAGQQAGMAGQRAALAGAQQGLGAAQLGLGQYQQGLGGTLQGFQGTDIARAGQVGAADQAFAQANIDAQREKTRMGLYEPYERMGFLGTGLGNLMGSMGQQYQSMVQPNSSPLATALGIGTTLGGIYGNVTRSNPVTNIYNKPVQ